MTIDAAKQHEVKAFEDTIDWATKHNQIGLAGALNDLKATCDGAMGAASGTDLRAQGDATRDIMYGIAAVVEEAMKIGKDPIHGKVQNLINSIENVANQVHAGNKSRMHQAVAQLT